MPKNPKQSAKVKETKVTPEPEQPATEEQTEAERLEEEQRRLREKAAQNLKQYNQRRVLLVESLKFFQKLKRNATEQRRQQARRKEWSDFLACQLNPNPALAPELRERLYQWRYEQDELERNSVSWTLAADDRSLLTQDHHHRGQSGGGGGKTRQDLKLLYRNVGAIYVPTIREAVAVLESIEQYARGGRTVPPEVLLARDEIRKFISDSLDRMTFRIGSYIGRDMETLNPVMGEFCYASDIVAVYLWSFRHVPLPPDYNLLMKVISMPPLGLTMYRPPAFNLKRAFIRGLWHGFDHYSSADPTYNLRPCAVEKPPSSGRSDLSTEQELEWKERQDIRRKRLTALRQLRDDYEAEERRKEAEAEALAAEQQKAGSSAAQQKKKKEPTTGPKTGRKKQGRLIVKAPEPPLPPVPLVITDETEVDIDAEYEQWQSDRVWESLVRIGPTALPLRKGYMNLREYAIVGGVYKLTRFAKLPQPVEPRSGFLFTTGRVGLKLTERGYRGRRWVGKGEELIKIQLQLPASCFWWEEPRVCWWERCREKSKTFARHPSPAGRRRKSTQLSAVSNRVRRRRRRRPTKGPKIVRDFSLHDRPVAVRLHFLIRDHILPRIPDQYRYRAELRQLYTILREHARRQRALDREQLVRDELVAAYDRFLAVHRYGDLASSSTPAIAEMRHPTEADIEVEKAGGKRRSRWTALGQGISSIVSAEEPKEMDEKLEQFPLVHPSRPRYLHPATLRSRQRPVMIATDQPGHPGHTIDADAERCMGELVRTLQAANTMDDEEAEERLCAHFSTFLRLLDYLREQEKPIFPVKPPPKVALEPVRASATGKQQQQKGQRQTVPQSYDPDQRIVTFWTDRFGVYGLAARRYSQLPFQHWTVRPNDRTTDHSAIVALKTATGLELAFHVSTVGYRLEIVAESVERSTPNAPLHSDPRLDTELTLDELEKLLVKLNLHLFPQPDTCFYANGSSSSATLKHDAMEMHNLQCLAVFCLTHQLEWCLWNRYADRRTALVQCRQLIEGRAEPELPTRTSTTTATATTIKITPLGVLTVEVEELCSPTLEQILLAYHPVPVDQSYNADCYGLLKGALEEPSRKVLSKTPPMLQWHVGQLLQKLRLLSYS
ncbi:uncharacterized protein LOC125950745 [Anopheles darlingi]|uniref:uncharacterized protein LOC125950745 n=1 Tax=Anopheles darlingi TaxID=43151 RepID=UPI002100573B|nr:uncharacterized protein LOC125950745 [Anopheles darlingi]